MSGYMATASGNGFCVDRSRWGMRPESTRSRSVGTAAGSAANWFKSGPMRCFDVDAMGCSELSWPSWPGESTFSPRGKLASQFLRNACSATGPTVAGPCSGAGSRTSRRTTDGFRHAISARPVTWCIGGQPMRLYRTWERQYHIAHSEVRCSQQRVITEEHRVCIGERELPTIQGSRRTHR